MKVPVSTERWSRTKNADEGGTSRAEHWQGRGGLATVYERPPMKTSWAIRQPIGVGCRNLV